MMEAADALLQYVADHTEEEPLWLRQIDHRTHLRLLNPRMCSGHVQGRLLKLFTCMIRPQRVLELGTYSAYSALCIAEGLEGDARIDTVEINDELGDFIAESLAAAPAEIAARVRVHFGDALQLIDRLDAGWDLVFMDADKRLYTQCLSLLLPRMNPGGWILADNTLWGGNILDARHDRDPQTVAIREFNERVAADSRLEAAILPLRDGLTIIRKRL